MRINLIIFLLLFYSHIAFPGSDPPDDGVVYHAKISSETSENLQKEQPEQTIKQHESLTGIPKNHKEQHTLFAGRNMFVYAGNDTTICLVNDSIEVFGYAENYHFVSWGYTGDGFFYNPTRLKTAYVPGPQDITNGETTVYLVAISSPPDYTMLVDSLVLTIVAPPTGFAGPDQSVCAGNSLQLEPDVLFGSGILWSTSGDGTFDDPVTLTPEYSPGPADISSGQASISLTVFPNSPCVQPNINTMLLHIKQAPLVEVMPDTIICRGDTLQLQAEAMHYFEIGWATSGDGTFSDPSVINPVYYPGYEDSENGSANLMIALSPNSPCVNYAFGQIEVTIQSPPNVWVGPDQEVCEDDLVICEGWAENFDEINWLVMGGNGYFDDPTSLNPVYFLGEHEKNTGVFYLILIASPIGPCIISSDDFMKVNVRKMASVSAGDDMLSCENNEVTLAGESTNTSAIIWETLGDGSFDDPESVGAVYFPGPQDITVQEAVLIISGTSVSPCSGYITDTTVISIQPAATVFAGDDITGCAETTLAGVSTHQSGVLWTTQGDGTFEDPSVPGTTYFSGAEDILSGTVTLTLSVNPQQPCTGFVSDDVVLNIDFPEIINGELTDAELYEGETLNLLFEAESLLPGSYQWYLDNMPVSGSSNLIIGNITAENAGSYHCIYSNGCFQVSSDTARISVFEETSQLLLIEDGWNAVSSFIYPENSNIEVILDPIIDDLIIIFNDDGVFFPLQDILTFTDWVPNTGYIIKSNNSDTLEISGYRKYPADEISIVPGWSIFPVNINCPLSVSAIFSGIPEIEIIKEIGGTRMFWPAKDVYSLEDFYPGKAYEIYNSSAVEITITFPDCED